MTIQKALERVDAAKQHPAQAEHNLEDARAALDGLLAERGWTRLVGGFNRDATPLYTNPLYPGATLSQTQVLEVIAQQRKPAAA
jgi:hypothetical protein